jgi:hypothetical protein
VELLKKKKRRSKSILELRAEADMTDKHEAVGVFDVALLDPLEALEHNEALRNLRRSKQDAATGDYGWLISELEQWLTCAGHCLIVANGPYGSRFLMKDVCIDLVRFLQSQAKPVIWALRADAVFSEQPTEPTIVDVLKYLVLQARRLRQLIPSYALEDQLAQTEEEWFYALRSELSNSQLSEVFIVLDVEIANAALNTRKDASIFWQTNLGDFLLNVVDNLALPTLKIALISYGSLLAAVPMSGGQLTKTRLMMAPAPPQASSPRPLRRHPHDASNLQAPGFSQLEASLKKSRPAPERSLPHVQNPLAREYNLPLLAAELPRIHFGPSQATPSRLFELFDSQTASANA